MRLRKKFTNDADFDAVLIGRPQSVTAGVVPLKAGTHHLPAAGDIFSGVVNLNPRGFGFVTTEAGFAYFIRAKVAQPLLTGDRITFSLTSPLLKRASAAGNVSVHAVHEIARKASALMCEVISVDGEIELLSDDPCFLDLVVSDSIAVSVGDVVAVKVPAYRGAPSNKPIQALISRNLGPRTRPHSAEFQFEYALSKFEFDEDIPTALKDGLPSDLISNVKPAEAVQDYRNTPFVTIDGESTLDVDDAVYARRTDSGLWQLKVAIADVSSYVKPGSALDKWAAQRGTSIYLPGRTIPMLPKALSTQACSLLPNVPRKVAVLSMLIDSSGMVIDGQITRGIIRSVAKLTYAEVANYLGGEAMPFSVPVTDNLTCLAQIAELLSAKRAASGQLEFDDGDPVFVQNEAGSWELTFEARTPAHKLIEEVMLLANTTAASLLIRRYGTGLFRHQPSPGQDDWAKLMLWAQSVGETLPQTPNLRAMTELVKSQKGDAQLTAACKVKSIMRPAKYAVQTEQTESGHFSLNADWYTHFTSPIRRYADLMVHRLLLAPEGYLLCDKELDLFTIQVDHCSERNKSARMAERSVHDGIKLQGFIGETPNDLVLNAAAVRCSERGLRMVLSTWQCSAWLPAAELVECGYSWKSDAWIGPDSNSGLPTIIQEGCNLPVTWERVDTTRPANPEIQLKLNIPKTGV